MKPRRESDPEMLDEYDFSGGVRGKYVDRFPKGSNVAVLARDGWNHSGPFWKGAALTY